ncbi:MAG: DUF6445 family protein [Pseudomonadota bacterium]
MDIHRDITIRSRTIGNERAPLLVIDNLLADADELVHIATQEKFTAQSRYYPGIRTAAPQAYQDLLAARLADTLAQHFDLAGGRVVFSLCHFSLVTTPPGQLEIPQRIPHVDSLSRGGLASIHYLFKQPFGGTAFYRHRKTGFEYIDESRNETYLRSLRDENLRPQIAGPGYINGDTALFEQVAREDGVFNRMLVYRRNSLHSGCIDERFVPDPDPRTGRLSINSFLDLVS